MRSSGMGAASAKRDEVGPRAKASGVLLLQKACGFGVRAGGFAPSVTGNRSELEWIGAGCHVSVSPTRIRGLLEFGV